MTINYFTKSFIKIDKDFIDIITVFSDFIKSINFTRSSFNSLLSNFSKFLLHKLDLAYSPSYNLIPPISRVLIGQDQIFCSLNSPTCCNSSQKCAPVKYKKRQKTEFPIVTWTTSCYKSKNTDTIWSEDSEVSRSLRLAEMRCVQIRTYCKAKYMIAQLM